MGGGGGGGGESPTFTFQLTTILIQLLKTLWQHEKPCF